MLCYVVLHRGGLVLWAAWNAAGTFEERDVSEWARDWLSGLLVSVEYDEDRELVLEQCTAATMQGSATIFSARGKTKCLFDLRFELEWSALVRVNSSKVEARVRARANVEAARESVVHTHPHATAQRPRTAHVAVASALMHMRWPPRVVGREHEGTLVCEADAPCVALP